MLNTIFKKQFIAYMGMLLITFIILAAVMTAFFSSYVMNQKQKYLEEASRKIAGIYRQTILAETYPFVAAGLSDRVQRQMTTELQNMQTYMNVRIFLTDGSMTVNGYSSDITELSGITVTDTELVKVKDGATVTAVTTLNGIFAKFEIIVGCPVFNSNNEVAAAVFVSAPLADVQQSTREIIKIIIASLLASAFVSFVLIYTTSSTISKPIRRINLAAKEISAGDFEKRIVVRSADEVGQLAESFNEMAESLSNQEKYRQEFIANISHDLHSPLTSMKGFLSAVIDGTIPPERREHYLGIVLEESDRLAKLANDMMEISKLQNLAVELNRSEFDISELIRKTVIMFETRITAKNINMEITLSDEKMIVSADTEKIQRVIYNLLDNAIKFSETGGSIYVETARAADKLFVSVKDNGRGISLEEQKRIFERFYKADSSRGEDKLGSGLGLSIVREFVKAHGEVITIKSEPGKGCEFVFTLSL